MVQKNSRVQNKLFALNFPELVQKFRPHTRMGSFLDRSLGRFSVRCFISTPHIARFQSGDRSFILFFESDGRSAGVFIRPIECKAFNLSGPNVFTHAIVFRE